MEKISKLPLTVQTQRISNTIPISKFVDLLEFSEGVSPLPASLGMATVATKKNLSFVVFWYAENLPKSNDKSQQL